VYGSAFWQPVLAVQSGIARSSIKLLQLADRGNAPAFARAISGRLTRTRPLSGIAPLDRDGATTFTDRNPASAMVNPSSLLQISGGQVVLAGPAISAAGSGDSPWVTLPAGQSAPVTSVGYGTLEQSGGAGRTKVLAAQAGAYV
jgi:hypothetical protein